MLPPMSTIHREGRRYGCWPICSMSISCPGKGSARTCYFFNIHDASGAIKVVLTPIRVVCQNTLNLALSRAKRSWSMIHTEDIKEKMQEAKDTLFMAENYMDKLGKEFEALRMKKLTDKRVMEYIESLLPIEDSSTPQQEKNMKRLREDMKIRYFDASDLQDVGNNAYRFVNAVSDIATHSEPLRRTANYKENLFSRTVEGNPMIDKACQMACCIVRKERAEKTMDRKHEATVMFPDILTFLYGEWLRYEDSYTADVQYCLERELAELRRDYKDRKGKTCIDDRRATACSEIFRRTAL